MICCTLAAAIVTSLVAYLESAERGMLKTIFSKHISGPVVDALMKDRDQFLDGGRLKPTRVTATVLFTDLKGFSTTSEAMEPAALMEWMNEYFDGIATHVDNCGGIINKFIGDAIMGVFGVPVGRTTEAEMDTDAKNAVDCALAMRASLLKLNEGWSATGRPTTAMRIGIHPGALVSGNVGSEARLEYTVLGDTVNTAARLESAGKDVAQNTEGMQCMILISDATCQRLHGGYVTRPLGAINLKGKAVQVVVHSVISKKQPTDL
jgi:adenylate cyclase